MAYNGYLLKVIDPDGQSDFTFPNSVIKVETYSAKRNVLYVNSYTDANGYTQADALQHRIDKIKFNTISMTGTEFDALMASLSALYTEPISRTFDCEFFVPETGAYQTERVHLNDFEPPILRVDDDVKEVYYGEIPLTITVW